MNVKFRLLYKFQGGQFSRRVFASMPARKILIFAGILPTLQSRHDL